MALPGGSSPLNPLFQIISFGAGTAMGPVLRPTLQSLANETWQLNTVRPFGPEIAAALAVEGVWTPAQARDEGNKTGFSDGHIDALIQLADDPPALAYLYELLRRGRIDPGKFSEALRHHRIETDYFADMLALQQVLLTPGELAQARQRGFISPQEQYDEAELQGVNNARAEIQFKSAGLPPPPERALAMWRRGILTPDEFKQTIVEGNEKLKYQDEEAALFRALLSPGQIVNQHLRGWRSFDWMKGRLGDYGFNAEDALDLFQGQGRPLSTRQVFIGLRRGGVYDGPTGDIHPALLKQMQESNIRPEWFDLDDAQKESYPSAFVIRQLATSGALDPTQTHRVLMEIGWPVWLIDAVVEAWTGGGAAATATSPLVKSAQTQAITEIRAAYVVEQADEPAARAWLTRLGVGTLDQDGMIVAWNVMREVPQKSLTPTQIKAAYAKPVPGWTFDRARDELVSLGLTLDDATTFLQE